MRTDQLEPARTLLGYGPGPLPPAAERTERTERRASSPPLPWRRAILAALGLGALAGALLSFGPPRLLLDWKEAAERLGSPPVAAADTPATTPPVGVAASPAAVGVAASPAAAQVPVRVAASPAAAAPVPVPAGAASSPAAARPPGRPAIASKVAAGARRPAWLRANKRSGGKAFSRRAARPAKPGFWRAIQRPTRY